MPKFLLHVPIFGSIDIVVEAADESELLDKYSKEKDKLLEYNYGTLYDSIERVFVVEMNDGAKC